MPKDITGNPKKKQHLTELQHPEWLDMHHLWFKWRMVYEGGDEFINEFLQRYSKREEDDDFRDRKAITYNPNHAASLINMVRNALASKLPEVQRTGDDIYVAATANNIDTFNSSMAAFMATEIIPLLLAQGKRFIVVDAPILLDGEQRTLADDADPGDSPYIYAVNAEDVVNWTYSDTRTFDAILIKEIVDTIDDESGLVSGTRKQFRYMKMLEEGETFSFNGAEGEVVLTGKGVLVRVFGENDNHQMEDVLDPVLLPLEQIPVVEFRLVDSLLKDIGGMQCTILNLTSSDVTFLHKGNFPIYVEQYLTSEAGLVPHGTKRQQDDFDTEIDDEDSIDQDIIDDPIEAGVNQGVAFPEGTSMPAFIAPAVANTKLSMEKQNEIARTMRQMLDLSLVSLSTSAVEQSGKSKEADKVGEEEGLAYVASVLETGERQTAVVFHDYIKSNKAQNISYPKGFSLKTPEERQTEIDALRKKRTAIRSPAAAKLVDRRIAQLQLEELSTPEELATVMAEINAQPFIDDDEQRAEAIRADVSENLLSHNRGSELRGHEPGEFTKRVEEEKQLTDAAMGSQIPLPDGGTEDDVNPLDNLDDEDETDDDDANEEDTDDSQEDDDTQDDEDGAFSSASS